LVNKEVTRDVSLASESKQQAVLRAACCVFGARCKIVRDVVFDALLSRPCAWLHLVANPPVRLVTDRLEHGGRPHPKVAPTVPSSPRAEQICTLRERAYGPHPNPPKQKYGQRPYPLKLPLSSRDLAIKNSRETNPDEHTSSWAGQSGDLWRAAARG